MKGTVLITGAAKRLGRAIALYMAEAGWDVALHYHASRVEAEETASLIRAMERKAYLVRADLADRKAIEEIMPSLKAQGCILTALVNNAALFERDTQDPDGARHRAINVDAPATLSERFARDLPPGTPGAIVNILDGTPIPAFLSAYRASKESLSDATRTMAIKLAPHVRVNAVAPGPTIKNARQSDAHFAHMIATTPLKIATPPKAVAAAVQWLIENPAITGEIIHIDGGMHLTATTS